MKEAMGPRGIGLAVAALLVLGAVLATGRWGVPWQRNASGAGHDGHPYLESPAIRHPEVSGMRAVSRTPLDPPVAAADFGLVDHLGNRVALADMTGKTVLMSFLYTNCPEACPLTTAHYLELQRRFADEVASGKLALVLVTTDPERDTPEALRAYTEARGAKWTFLTGDLQTMQRMWADYDVYHEIRRDLYEVVVYHSYRTYLVDSTGMIRFSYDGVWQPSEMATDIEGLLG